MDVRVALRQFRDKMISRLQEGSGGNLDLSLDMAARDTKMEGND